MAPAHLISVSVPCSIISLDGHFADCPPLSQTDHKALADMPSSAPNLADGLSTHKSHACSRGMMGDMFIGSINKAADGLCGD